MDIEIRCFATLADYAPKDGKLSGLPDGVTPALVMDLLGIPKDEVRIIFINGIHAEPNAALAQGDRLGLFPAVGGG